MNFPIIWAFQTEVSILCHTPFEGQSPWSEQDTCVPSCTCLECTWWREQRKTTKCPHYFHLGGSHDNAARCNSAELLFLRQKCLIAVS